MSFGNDDSNTWEELVTRRYPNVDGHVVGVKSRNGVKTLRVHTIKCHPSVQIKSRYVIISDNAVLNDYCDMYYFLNNDGRVYQCVNIERDALNRILTLSDTKMFIHYGYDKNSNRRYARAWCLGDNPHEEACTRESWYTYTPGDRTLIRDAVFDENLKQIQLAADQGMILEHGLQGIKRQTTLKDNAEKHVDLGYLPETSLLQTITSPGNAVTRAFDAAQRCDLVSQVRDMVENGNKVHLWSTDKTTFSDGTNFPRVQDRYEERDTTENGKTTRDQTRTERTVQSATKAGHPLKETTRVTVRHNNYEDKEAGYSFEFDDETDHHELGLGANGVIDLKVSTERKKTITSSKSVKHEDSIRKVQLDSTEDANGHYTSVRGGAHAPKDDVSRHFVTNSEDCIVFKKTQNGDLKKTFYIYVEKKPGKMVMTACFGDQPESESDYLLAGKYRPKMINLDTNHEGLSAQYPPPVARDYTVPRRMTYRELAEELNYTGYASTIAEANNRCEDDIIEAGERVSIPSLYFEIPETAWNGKMPSVDSIVGSLYPALPAPRIWLEPDKPKVNIFEIVLEAAAFAIIMAYMPALLMTASTGLFGAMGAYAVAGATADVVGQGIRAGINHTGFSLKEVMVSAVASAISGGVLQQNGLLKAGQQGIQAAKTAGSIGKSIAVSEEIAVAQHAVMLATGMERGKFDWRTLGTAAFNGAAGYTINMGVDSERFPVLNAGINAGVDGTASGLLNHDLNVQQLVGNTAGVMLGNYAVTELKQMQENHQRAKLQEAEKGKKPAANRAKTVARQKKTQPKMTIRMSQDKAETSYFPASSSSDAGMPGWQNKFVDNAGFYFADNDAYMASEDYNLRHGRYSLSSSLAGNRQHLYGDLTADVEAMKGLYLPTTMGAIEAAGGGLQVAAGTAMYGIPVVGPVLGTASIASGLDHLYTGGRNMWSNTQHDTVFVNAATALGMDRGNAVLGQGIIDIGSGLGAGVGKYLATQGVFKNTLTVKFLDPNDIRYSQATVSYLKKRPGMEPYTIDDIAGSMGTQGWQGDAIDVIRMPEGGHTTLDNTRVLAARQAGIEVKANTRNYNERLPGSMAERFEHPTVPGVFAKTWGEALEFRIIRQSNKFQNNNFPLGTYENPTITYSSNLTL